MLDMAERCKACRRYNTLLGIEGMAAKAYFGQFGDMLKRDAQFDFTERNRRPLGSGKRHAVIPVHAAVPAGPDHGIHGGL